jgi:hypothetical protein
MLRVHRLERSNDERFTKEREIRAESKATAIHLRKKLHEMRLQYSGAVTLEQHLKSAKRLQQFAQQRIQLEEELALARHAREAAETEAATVAFKHSELQELLVQLNTKESGSVKIVEWHQRMVDARVAEFQLKRKLDHTETRVRHLDAMIKEQEDRELGAEKELDEMKRTFEYRQMQWEKVEDQLEEKITRT